MDTWTNFNISLFSNKISFSISRLVLDKTLEYCQYKQKEMNIGNVINLGTVDSNKFNGLSYIFLYIIISPIMIIFGLLYLYFLVGPSIFIGLAFMILTISINIFIVKKRVKYNKEFLKISGVRIKKFTEVYNNIIYIKANNYENHYFNILYDIRM